MNLPPHPSQIKVLLLSLLLLPSPINSLQPNIDLNPFPTPNQTLDYGRVIQHSPFAILKPKTPQDVSLLLKSISSSSSYNNLTVAPRGAGHSTYGQAQALGGIVIDMTSLPNSFRIEKTNTGSSNDNYFIDVGGGVLWIEILMETLKHGLSPRSWTDYLYLTVGGTLSVGGVSGQTFKYGPQISNVLEMDVVTGEGELVTCSKIENSELFYGVLGGLGQFGIITRARIMLMAAPQMVKWVRISYLDFDQFTKDEELLISMDEVDYVEGFIKFQDKYLDRSWSDMPSRFSGINTRTNSTDSSVYYSIEMAVYYDEAGVVGKTMDQVLSRLGFMPITMQSLDVSYLDFLNRVRAEELSLRSRGLWEVAHPWLNLFVPRLHIRRFKDLLLETISSTSSDGPIIVYPILKHKWNPKMSARIPQDDAGENIVYVVSVLRSAAPSCTSGSPCLDTLLRQNQLIIDIATSKANVPGDLMSTTMASASMPVDSRAAMCGTVDGMGAKQYMPYWKNEKEWKLHFGDEWERFKKLKSKFDPLNILAPGQRIFKRKWIEA